jgi:hypothetical protein
MSPNIAHTANQPPPAILYVLAAKEENMHDKGGVGVQLPTVPPIFVYLWYLPCHRDRIP